MSAPVLVLFLTDGGISAYRATRREAVHLADFPVSPQPDLREFIREWQTAEFHLLVDLAEEAFHPESVPHLARADREALLLRKLEQAFRQTPYRRAVVQVAGKRGAQDKLLLSALTAPEKLDALVETLLQAQCAIAGIHSVALTAEALLAKRISLMPHCLLVTPSPGNGLRQSHFTQEGLRFSRLTHCTANNTAEEVRKTRQFLTTTRQMLRDEPLEVLLLGDAGVATQLPADTPQINARHESIADFAAKIGLPSQTDNWAGLLCTAIARGLIPDHYRPASAARYQRLHKLGQTLQWSAALLLLLAMVASLFTFHQSRQQQEENRLAEQKLQHPLQRQREFEGKLKALDIGAPGQIGEVVELHRRYIAGWLDVETTAQAVSLIFADYPQLQLERFDWQLANAGHRSQMVDLAGRLRPDRQAQGQLEAFAARLGQLPRATVSIPKRPLDLSPHGELGGGENRAPAASDFLIRLVIAPEEAAKP
ncbi:hypothetical protein SAMN05660284_02632 [Formivibrio citricus]|uniref:Uncharacterized protein n=1 Tax=Formivibrio citricus TaxID=83765 RepID=A0A1I5DDB6_9NEIS|nr:hypothetical protein [Formivibrio citricus]SFN97190.1 hypothetical protein SAMN05660284_02632 [Formivibrio citricus]